MSGVWLGVDRRNGHQKDMWLEETGLRLGKTVNYSRVKSQPNLVEGTNVTVQ